MATVTINGRAMDAGELKAEVVGLTNELIKKARLEDPLPPGQDLTEEEDSAVQLQIHAIYALPQDLIDLMLAAICANHASKIANALRQTSLETQPKAFATYVQILSFLPEAAREPYYRLFLLSPDSKGLANIIGNAFAQGIQWRRPSEPGSICGLLIELLFWCDTAEGDDKKAAMDAEIRKRVGEKTTALKLSASFERLPITQRLNVERLDGVINVIEQMPDNTYLWYTRESLKSESEGICGNDECDKAPTMRCSGCKSVEYCGKKCQTKHWKQGHKSRCFSRAG